MPRSERGTGFDRPLPAKGGVGGEKGEVRELKGTTAHLYMPEIEVGVACGGGATRAGGRRRRELVGGVLRWHWAARVESVSTGVSVGCSWEG